MKLICVSLYRQYSKIMNREQRCKYKNDFNRIYTEYKCLHNELEQTTQVFKELEKSLEQHEQGSPEFRVSFYKYLFLCECPSLPARYLLPYIEIFFAGTIVKNLVYHLVDPTQHSSMGHSFFYSILNKLKARQLFFLN